MGSDLKHNVCSLQSLKELGEGTAWVSSGYPGNAVSMNSVAQLHSNFEMLRRPS